MDRVVHCAGSVAAERDLPPLPSQQVTQQGTNIHDALESGDDSELELTEQEIKDRLSSLEKETAALWYEEFNLEREAPTVREKRFWIRERKSLDLLASARLDFALVHNTHALVINYKSGYADSTPSERNWQCRTEVIALWQEFPQLEHIRGGIVQSRLYSKIDLTDYQLEDLVRIEREIRHVLWRASQPDAARVPGPHCRYCRALAHCREAAAYVLMPPARIAPYTVRTNGKIDVLAIGEAISKLAPNELAFLYQRRKIADAVFDAVEARMKTLAADELRAIGYKVAEGNRNKIVVNAKRAYERLGELLSEEERFLCIRISRGPAAELIAAKRGISQKAAGELIVSTLGDALVEKIGNPKLQEV